MTAKKISTLTPCPEGLNRARECATLREWWDTSTTLRDMTWLIGRAHSHGTLARRRLVALSLRCVETVMHLVPPECETPLARLCEWVDGDDAVDLEAVKRDLLLTYAVAYAASATASAYAAAAAATTATAYTAASAAYTATASAYAAAAAATTATAYTASDAAAAYTAYVVANYAAMCDVIRDAIAIDEVCEALGLDPDQGCDQ